MRIYRRGDVFWCDWIAHDGQRHRKSLRTRIRREAEWNAHQLVQGCNPLRMDELLERWLRWKEQEGDPLKPRTLRFLRQASSRFVREFGDLPANDVPQARIDAYRVRRRAEAQPQTVNNDLDGLRNLFRFGLEAGLIQAAPHVKRIRVKARRVPKELSREQVRELLDAAAGDRLEPVIRLALFAGLRAEECIYTHWADVDLDNGWVHVTRKPDWSPKSASERSVPISDGLVAYLQRLRTRLRFHGPTDPVCQRDPTIGACWRRVWMGECVRRLFDGAGVELPVAAKHKLHLLRGTYATNCLRGGADLESLRVNLGHTDLKVTAAYLAATDESRRKSIQGLDALWGDDRD